MNTGGDPIMTTASLAFFDRFLLGKKNGLKRVEKAVQAVGHRDPAQALVT